MLDGGFEGKLYAVGRGGQIWGMPIYPNIKDIPGTVDYVIVAIPKHLVLDLLDDCAAKGVKVVQLFTAGFSEARGGSELEEEMVRRARRAGIHIIGPNCIGVYCPASGMNLPGAIAKQMEKGSAAFISQSGGHAGAMIEMGFCQGIRFSKVVSFGNGCDLDSVDFLEYLALDPETEIICAYLEGVKNGTRLVETIKQVSRVKPLIIWKGGRTRAGAKAATSHTGSISSADAFWAAALRQAGAVKVGSLEELADTMLAFQQLHRWEGNRVAIITGTVGAGGGACVAGSDACLSEGLEVPFLSDETREQLEALLPPAGSISHNPVDVGMIAAFNMQGFARAMELVLADPNIDLAMIHLPLNYLVTSLSQEEFHTLLDILIHFRNTQDKPLIVIAPPFLVEAQWEAMVARFSQPRIPVYPSFERAAKAIAKVMQYWEHRTDEGTTSS
jgi:acyl-CoA synthetase (NDP forming)